MDIRYAVSRTEYSRMNSAELRAHFLIESLFAPGRVVCTYCETERAVVGSAVPTGADLALEPDARLAADTFCERREVGVINIGGAGTVNVDGRGFELGRLDGLYIGRGSREVVFRSRAAVDPARFYFVSYPAHQAYPTTLVPQASATARTLGSAEASNARTIRQYIHPGSLPSCQLVMGYTELKPGSVWNTMPCHTHERRTEVYLYVDIPESAAVFHFMGPADETRHLVVAAGQAVVSPMWSIHSGCGTQPYGFIWAMGGENQRFDDMDHLKIVDLK
ncbi:MAG: 5-dehydro-4-deoxy-D-glucuronate isomerase [Lentisphaerae bacterium]|nr:5-dehydro-4-deoxy-D-glucuronate isomerase [Lentisphaerota bacterium]